jgi:hypothetical protein
MRNSFYTLSNSESDALLGIPIAASCSYCQKNLLNKYHRDVQSPRE